MSALRPKADVRVIGPSGFLRSVDPQGANPRALLEPSSSEGHERVLSGIVVDERPLRPNRTEVNRRRQTDIGIYRPARVAAGEGVRHTIAAQERRLVVDVHVQMRFRRTAGIADSADNLADADLVTDLDLHGAGTHMRVQNVTVLRDFDDDMIARRIVEIYRNHILAGMGDVLRHAV